MRALEESKFIREIGTKKTKAGFEAKVFELGERAYLAVLLSSINWDSLSTEIDEVKAQTLIAVMIGTHNLQVARNR